MILAATANAAVFTCTDADGHRTFTDLGCPAHTTPAPVPGTVAPSQFMPFTPLDEAESARLAAVDKRLQENARRHRQRQAARRSDRARDEAQRQQRCAVAKQKLRALKQQRRKGYSLKDAAGLDAEDAALTSERAAICR